MYKTFTFCTNLVLDLHDLHFAFKYAANVYNNSASFGIRMHYF